MVQFDVTNFQKSGKFGKAIYRLFYISLSLISLYLSPLLRRRKVEGCFEKYADVDYNDDAAHAYPLPCRIYFLPIALDG